MHYYQYQKSVFTLFVILLITSSLYAQSKMEYGIGVGLIYGDYYEGTNFSDDYSIYNDEAQFSPAINLYAAYSVSEKIKVTGSPGINFHLHRETLSDRDLTAVYFHLPVGLQYQLVGDLSIMGDVFYDYLINQSYEYQGEHISVSDLADTRNLFGASLGVAYSIGRYAEIQLTASHQLNTVNSIMATGPNGNNLGEIHLKNRFLKLNLVFRG